MCPYLVISWSISKIQRPSWRARQDDSNEPSRISTALTQKSVAPQSLTGDMLRLARCLRASVRARYSNQTDFCFHNLLTKYLIKQGGSRGRSRFHTLCPGCGTSSYPYQSSALSATITGKRAEARRKGRTAHIAHNIPDSHSDRFIHFYYIKTDKRSAVCSYPSIDSWCLRAIAWLPPASRLLTRRSSCFS